MNEFDQFVKQKLKAKRYARYTDDFVIVSGNKDYLLGLLPDIRSFLESKLKLNLHPNKVSVRKFNQGIDFLGYMVLPYYCQLRTKTKSRMFKKLEKKIQDCKSGFISEQNLEQSLNSYLGVLSHADAYEIRQELINQYWFRLKE